MLLVFLEDHASITTIGWLTVKGINATVLGRAFRVPFSKSTMCSAFIQILGYAQVQVHRGDLFFIIWLQYYARSDWLFSSNDQAILARCPRDIQFVFNLILVILVDIHVIIDSCQKEYPLTSITSLNRGFKCTTH